jgi:methylated-DNA-protein-cysteine methyltransferase related protein
MAVKQSGNPKNKDFFKRVYALTCHVPYGRVTSYGALAKYLGSAQSARMVGWALNNCHTHHQYVPAHRVVNRTGQLSGKHHFGTPTAMQQLLENEGVRVEENAVVEFEKLFWDPFKELRKKSTGAVSTLNLRKRN